MKRILLLFLVFCGVTAFAQKPIYVYFNDGTLKAFLSSQVERMTLARLSDAPGDDRFVQEFWTADSVYRYPVQTIDSISSYIPPTEFKPEAIDLSGDLFEYVVSADTTHIFLQANTPARLLPTVGQKLGYPTIDEVFPYGFAGAVKAVKHEASQIIIDCDPVGLDKVFDTFYCIVTSEGREPSRLGRSSAPKAPLKEGNIFKQTFVLPSRTMALSNEVDKALNKKETLALTGTTEMSLTQNDSFDVTVFYVVNRDMGYNVQMGFVGTHDIETRMSVYGSLNFNKDFPFRNMEIKERLPYGVCFYANPGWFVNASAQLTLSAVTTSHFQSAGCYEYSSIGKAVLKPNLSVAHKGTDSEIEVTMDGRLATGPFMEFGFTIIDQYIDKVAFRCETGLELVGSSVLLATDVENGKHDTSVYQKLQKSPVTLGFYSSRGISVGVAAWSQNFTLQHHPYPPFWKRDMVPTFANTKFRKSNEENYALKASTEARGDCLFPVSVGFVVFDKDEEEIANYTFSKNYTNTPSLFQHDFNNLSIGKYTVYPQVSFMGFDLLASPSAAYELRESIPVITNVSQIGSDHSYEGFYYGGLVYRYKYELMVNAKIPSLNGVFDWGIVYQDPKGQNIRRSLKPQGTSGNYTFSIYTNQNPTISSVSTYVIYNDYEEIIGEDYNFELSQEEEMDIRDYLVRLYETAGGENWTRNDNWCSDLPVEEWYGVSRHYLDYSKYMISLTDNNLVGYIDMSGCTSLELLGCGLNQLTSLNVAGCSSLQELFCQDNPLASLDVAECTALYTLACEDTQLTSLDVAECTALLTLACNDTQLTSLDVAECTSLTELNCDSSQLTSLNVTGCTALARLSCDSNQLTSLNVSGCTALARLSCNNNQLTSLNVSGCTALGVLYCVKNRLTSLNVTECKGLFSLACSENCINQVIDETFDSIPDFYHDIKYRYYTDRNGKIAYITAPYGWWYPGEPGKGYHGK